MKSHRVVLPALLFAIAAVQFAGAVTAVTCDSPADSKPQPTEYFVSLSDSATHLAHVSIRVPNATGKLTLEMPVWNALYQVRNFAAYVENVRAQGASASPVSVVKTKTSQWEIAPISGCVVVAYDIHLDMPGPFGAQLNIEHAFFNWAMVLMYSPELRYKPVSIQMLDVPSAWGLRDVHVIGAAEPGKVEKAVGIAADYDTLVDSPVEIGQFQTYDFQQDGASYHVVVHAGMGDYDAGRLLEALKQITHAGVDWMNDRPYNEYTFLYHFPRGPGGGGMEHAYGTAIDVSAGAGSVPIGAVAEVSAHEFFHLWNVKRIRPQSLEPIDYQAQQETRALWFSEGFTSTVGDLLRSRAGQVNEREYLDGIANAITEVQHAPAHQWQSPEESSLDAWFEGNPFYRSPERSVSYYTSGDVLGTLLDLRIREATQDKKSLRDLFQWMNEQYAKEHRYFPDSLGVQEAAEAVTGRSFAEFFRDYVAGVKDVPYDDFFRFVGLQLGMVSVVVPEPGFRTTANLGGQPEVTSVQPDSEAAKAGLEVGDRITQVNGKISSPRMFGGGGAQLKPGDTVKLRVSGPRGDRKLKFKIGSRQEQAFQLSDVPNITPEQRRHRAAWICGNDEAGSVQ